MNFAQNQFYESRILLKISFSNSVEFAKKKITFSKLCRKSFFQKMDFTENQLIHTYLRWIQREYCRTNCQRKTTLYWLRATIFYHKRDHAEIKVNVSKYFLVLEWMGLRRSGPFRTPSLNLFLLSFLPRDPITYRWRERQTMNHITVNVNILPLCKFPLFFKEPFSVLHIFTVFEIV